MSVTRGIEEQPTISRISRSNLAQNSLTAKNPRRRGSQYKKVTIDRIQYMSGDIIASFIELTGGPTS